MNEGNIRGQLIELQEGYASGELDEEEYEEQEGLLLARLGSVREASKRSG